MGDARPVIFENGDEIGHAIYYFTMQHRPTHLIEPGRIEVVDEAVADVLRRKTPAERVAMVFACNRTMRSILHGGLESLHPQWTESEIQCEIARRMSGGTNQTREINGARRPASLHN